MTASSYPTIPYEQQVDPQSGRMCGAACLCMVYRSFGKAVSQPAIWPNTVKYDPAGRKSASTHLLAKEALERGFAAVAIQARHPLQALRLCREQGIRAILNHRLQENSPAGHFSVLVDIDAEHVVLHDPYFGPSRRLAHAELLQLWQPRFANAEIVGNMLIGIASAPPALPACGVCKAPLPPRITCPKCGTAVALQPAALLGCLASDCAARLWNYVCCPSCDYTFNFRLPSPAAPTPAAGQSVGDISKLFSELDKFCAHMLTVERAAKDPNIMAQIGLLKGMQEKLKLAQNEESARRQVQQAQLAQFTQKCQQEEAVIARKKAELATPAPALDGIALGEALLEQLGLLNHRA